MTTEISLEEFVGKLDNIHAPIVRGIVACSNLTEHTIDSQISFLVDCVRQIISSPVNTNAKIPSSIVEYYTEYFGRILTKSPIFGYKPYLFKLLNAIIGHVRNPRNYVAIALMRQACDDLESHLKRRSFAK